MPGNRIAIDCQPLCQPASGPSAVPAARLDQGFVHGGRRRACRRRSSSRPNRRSRSIRFARRASRPATRCRIDGRGLRERLATAHRHDGLGGALRGQHFAERIDVSIRNRSATERQAAEQYGASRRARTDLGQGGGAWSAEAGLAHGQMAGGLGQLAVLALRARSRRCLATHISNGSRRSSSKRLASRRLTRITTHAKTDCRVACALPVYCTRIGAGGCLVAPHHRARCRQHARP